MSHARRLGSALVALVIPVNGCGGDRPALAVDMSAERRPGIVELDGRPAQVDVPDTAAAGALVRVRVVTYGGGCMRPGGTDARVDGRVAEVRPYDSVRTRVVAPEACPAVLAYYPHEATVRFAAPGPATVRVYGRADPGGAERVIERTLTVR